MELRSGGGVAACAGSGLTSHCLESGTGELALPGAVPSVAAWVLKEIQYSELHNILSLQSIILDSK